MSAPSNQFLNGTARSNYAANTFFRDAMSRLSSNAATHPVVKTLYDRTAPLYEEWDDRYTAWLSTKGNYAGKTDEWENVANELASVKYQTWRAATITAGIAVDSPMFKTLFPNGSAYYHGGRYERRTAEVRTLAEQLAQLNQANFSAFQWTIIDALQKEVNDFLQRMVAVRNNQQESEKNHDDAPIELENARIALCIMLYRNLGILMDTYPEEPERVNAFYEWTVLRGRNKRKNADDTADPIEDNANDITVI